MDLISVLKSNFQLSNLVYTALQVIFIAIVFEFIAWWLGRRIEAATAPMMPLDAQRESNWRMRRRTTLRQTPKIVSRTSCYVIAGLLVLNIFGVPILPLSIGLGAVALLFGTALLPLMRDATQGYALLGEDVLAPGDVVEINGKRGTIEKWTLRALWLRDSENRVHCFSNRGVLDVTILQRREDTTRRDDTDPFAQTLPRTAPKVAPQAPPVRTPNAQ